MGDWYRAPETREETLTAVLVFVVPAKAVGSLSVDDEGSITVTRVALPEGFYTIIDRNRRHAERQRVYKEEDDE